MNGTFVIDGVVGDYLCEKFGDLRDTPLTMRVKDNRLVEAFSENKELENEFWKYTHTDENCDRVGEFAIGTNIELKHVIGNILQDEKIPRDPHRLRQSLRRPHRRRLVLVNPHRRRRPPLRHLGRRSQDHGRREVSDRLTVES